MFGSGEVEIVSAEVMSLLGTGRQVDPFSRRHHGFDLHDAYEVVARVRDLRIERGERPVGRKIGFTNRSMWQGHGISAPIWNYVFDRTVVHVEDAEATVDLQGLPEPRVEPEVVLHLGAAPQPRMASPDLLECIDWVAPGFEVVFSVFPGWQFAASDAAAAFGVHGALFVGKRVEVAPIRSRLLDELDHFKVALENSDGVRREGSGGNVLGGPVHALKFLVDELARFPICEPLQPGELVTTGTLTEAMPLRPGQRWSAAFDGIDFHRLRLVVA